MSDNPSSISLQNPTLYSKTAYSTTYAAPTLVTEGFDLTNSQGLRLIVVAPSTTFSTASTTGYMRYLYWDPTLATWIRDPLLDQTLDSAVTGLPAARFPDVPVFVPYGRGIWVPDTIGLSAGSAVDVYVNIYRGR